MAARLLRSRAATIFDMSVINILGLSGSLRRSSSNTRVLGLIGDCCPSSTRFELFQGLDALPHFNPDVEAQGLPAEVEKLHQSLERSQALIVSCPEYAHGLPGTFKNALDWLVCVGLDRRPVALINTSARATHAPAQLREVLKTMDGEILEQACFTLELPAQSSSDQLEAAKSGIHQCLNALFAATASSS